MSAPKPVEPGLLDRRYPTCNARKRQGEGLCTRPAGWGTNHPGHGRCKLHGGVLAAGLVPRTPSENAPTRLQERHQQWLQNPNLLNLRHYLAWVSAVLEDFIEATEASRAMRQPTFDLYLVEKGEYLLTDEEQRDLAAWARIGLLLRRQGFHKDVAELANLATTTIERIRRVEEGLKLFIHVQEISEVVERMVHVLTKHVTDEETLGALIRALETEFGWAGAAGAPPPH